ncbi:TolB family protein [Arenimonas terrae]|uniref:Uncharacterized protein n=1 Tax=Arenimonas terrae TaxID=2546226 RepID=A0A5C4RXM7_9GAMM|nr:PD40 domain-containing protein [Arenimonas terrae]TNJ35699.1 hypothetical protein E1B00_08120 [Arenimonas terrae]
MIAVMALGIGGALLAAGAETLAEPQVWTPPALSTADYEATPTFSADGRELYFMRSDPGFARYSLYVSHCGPDGWSAPVPPPFARPLPVFDGDPQVAPDGRTLWFISTRQNTAAGDEDFDIWRVERRDDGGWGAPERLPEPVNSPASELLPRATADGRLVFGSDRAGGHGGTDIYEARAGADGEWTVRNLGPPVNSAHSEYEADISADGRHLVVVADRGDRSHLYRFERGAGAWRETGRVPARADVFQVGPLLSPHADRLLFAQAEPGRSGELMLVELRPGAEPGWPPRCPGAN